MTTLAREQAVRRAAAPESLSRGISEATIGTRLAAVTPAAAAAGGHSAGTAVVTARVLAEVLCVSLGLMSRLPLRSVLSLC